MTLASGFSSELTASPEALQCATFIIAAFTLSGVAHIFWLRIPASLRLAFPIDCGVSLFGKRLFGDHKMLRGFVVMVPATGASFALLFILMRSVIPEFATRLWSAAPWHYAALGAWAGFGFMAGELPNSFIKRRLGITPGDIPSHPAARWACLLVDRLDSILGMLAAMSIVVTVPALTWLYVLVFGAGI